MVLSCRRLGWVDTADLIRSPGTSRGEADEEKKTDGLWWEGGKGDYI